MTLNKILFPSFVAKRNSKREKYFVGKHSEWFFINIVTEELMGNLTRNEKNSKYLFICAL